MKLQDMSDVSDVDFDVLSLVDFKKWSDKGLPENRRQTQATAGKILRTTSNIWTTASKVFLGSAWVPHITNVF